MSTGRQGRGGRARAMAWRSAATAVAVLTAGACAGGADGGGSETGTGAAAVEIPDTGSVATPDSAVGDGGATAAEEGNGGPPPLPGEGEPRVYRLRLVNPLDEAARVFGSAGAARVALDTVPPRDSTLVDVRLRADRIRLEAEDEDGRGLGAVDLDLLPGEPNRWLIGPPAGPRVATREAPPSL